MASHGNFLANFFFYYYFCGRTVLGPISYFCKTGKGCSRRSKKFQSRPNKDKKKKTKTIVKNRIVKKVKSHPLFHLHAEIYIAHCRSLSHGEVT